MTLSPLTLFLIFFSIYNIKKPSLVSKKEYEKADGIAEEILYNIQTVCSFGNFEYERERFNNKLDLVFIDLSTYIAFTIVIFYGNKIISVKEIIIIIWKTHFK